MPDNVFQSGMVRSSDSDKLDFTSLPMVGLIGVARTAAEGAAKYGRMNYVLGAPCHDYLNHAMRHIVLFLSGDRSEPHLPHAAWGLLAATQSHVLDPKLSAGHLLGPGATLSPACCELLDSGAVDRARLRAEGAFEAEGDWKTEDLPEIRTILSQRAEAELVQAPAPAEATAPAVIDNAPAVESTADDEYGSDWPDEEDDYTDDRLIDSKVCQRSWLAWFEKTQLAHPPKDLNGNHKLLTYVAGPMSGMPDHNFPAFDAAATWLRGQGYPVHSPHDSGVNPDEDYAAALNRALNLELQCKQVVMLPGWETSIGATAERTVAIALRMPVKYMRFFDGKPFLLSDTPV